MKLKQWARKSKFMRHIAEAKKKTNIAEYLLYMWQMEDLIRGLKFDFEAIEHAVLAGVEDGQQRRESSVWFADLLKRMKTQRLTAGGHLEETYEIIGELQLLQHTLSTVLGDAAFKKVLTEVQPLLAEFRTKTDKVPMSDIETALTAVYGYLSLKLAGKKVTSETESAVKIFTTYLAHLSRGYREMKSGQLPLNN